MFYFSRLVICIALLLSAANSALAQDEKKYHLLSFDEKGKLEGAKSWASAEATIVARKPKHVFLIAHGWLTSKNRADKTYTYFEKHLREAQEKDADTEVIGVRWPSLLGENETDLDKAFHQVAKTISVALSDSKTVKERKAKLKPFLKATTTRFLFVSVLKFKLPPDEEIDALIDNFEDIDNVEAVLSAFTYYEMKRRAGLVGATGLQDALTNLRAKLPGARFHLIGHSFGCKVCLECVACDARADTKVDSLTLLQGAVSMTCFAGKVDDRDGSPCGAYAHLPKRVQGPIVVTYTKNDKALMVAYPAASQAAGQIGELPMRRFQLKVDHYGALGGKGIVGVEGIAAQELLDAGMRYALRPGLNAINADKVMSSHGDHLRKEVVWLVWSAARFTNAAVAGGPSPALKDIAWFTGQWRSPATEKMLAEEHWSEPAGRSMIGMFRLVSGEKPVIYEFLMLEETADGVFMRLRHFKGAMAEVEKAPIRLKLTRTSASEAIFENPDNEKPRRIIYSVSNDVLTVIVETTRDGKQVSFSIKMQRVKK